LFAYTIQKNPIGLPENRPVIKKCRECELFEYESNRMKLFDLNLNFCDLGLNLNYLTISNSKDNSNTNNIYC